MLMRLVVVVVTFATLACGSQSSQSSTPAVAPPSPSPRADVAVPVDAGAPVAPAPPSPEPESDVATTLPMLQTNGTMFSIVTEGTKTTCREWRIEGGRFGKLVTRPPIGRTEVIWYQNDPGSLVLQKGVEVGDRETRRCHVALDAHESEIGIEIGNGQRWFRKRDDCMAALASKQRAAVDFSECLLRPRPTPAGERAATKKLETLLSRGGSAYAVVGDRCITLEASVKNRGKDNYGVEGSLTGDAFRGELRGIVTYDYKYDGGKLELAGPKLAWQDGSTQPAKCTATRSQVPIGVDAVELDQPLYLTAAACRSALAHDKELRAWLPVPPAGVYPQLALTCQMKRLVNIR